jgi:hypothetical protein
VSDHFSEDNDEWLQRFRKNDSIGLGLNCGEKESRVTDGDFGVSGRRGTRMNDLRSRAKAFLRGPCIIGEHWLLLHRYIDGELGDDPEVLKQLSHCLRTAREKAAAREGATGPAGDALLFYQRAATLFEDIQAQLSARMN